MTAKTTWKLVETKASQSSRGTFDLTITDGKHILTFESCSNGGDVDPLAWAAEQAEAFSAHDLKIACSHCPDKGIPVLKADRKEAK